VITISQSSPHTRLGVTPSERDRIFAAFTSGEVINSATTLLCEVRRNLEEAGIRLLITHAINAAASVVMDNGRTKPLAELEPTDVVRALESTIVEVQIEREAERVRQQAHTQAQQAADAEWDELSAAVNKRHIAAAAELAHVVELLLGSKAVDTADEQQALEKYARGLAAKIARLQAFAADRRRHYWAPYDIDTRLDDLLEVTADRLGIPEPEAPIEAPAA